MLTKFSSADRSTVLARLEENTFDVLIIGGGITGAGIALDASSRGLKVALLEMQDYASGTSGRSTKLIHGGLRYLKQLEFSLVAEVGRERKIIHQLAPHLTKPEPMLLPLMKGDALGKFSSRIGMYVYERLAGVLPSERNKFLNPSLALKQEPLLKPERLQAGILFYEYRTDDARLTMEVLKQAVYLGTTALNYTQVTGFINHKGKVSGANAKDLVTGKEVSIRAKYVVNAAGPWVDEIVNMDARQNSRLKITKGIHLVFDGEKLPARQSIYFEAADKRMLFVIPRSGKTYVGTTDTFYEGEKQHPEITLEDRDYVVSSINTYFRTNLQSTDIESAWVGLRPLINNPGKKAGEISRRDELFISDRGLITIAGGKLTGYRKMAERVLNVISQRFKKDADQIIPPCTTDRIYLSGGKLDKPFDLFLKDKVEEGITLGLTSKEATEVVYRFGSNTTTVYDLIKKLRSREIEPSKHQLPEVLYAQLLYCVQFEQCLTVSDFLIRRTGLFYFDISMAEKWSVALIEELKELVITGNTFSKKMENEMQVAFNTIHNLQISKG